MGASNSPPSIPEGQHSQVSTTATSIIERVAIKTSVPVTAYRAVIRIEYGDIESIDTKTNSELTRALTASPHLRFSNRGRQNANMKLRMNISIIKIVRTRHTANITISVPSVKSLQSNMAAVQMPTAIKLIQDPVPVDKPQ